MPGSRSFGVDRPGIGQSAEIGMGKMGKGRTAEELDAELHTGLVVSSDARTPPTADEVALLAHLAAAQDLLGALKLVASLVSEGVSRASVLLLLVDPAARLLHHEWAAQQRAFPEVMEALKVVQHVADALRPSPPPSLEP